MRLLPETDLSGMWLFDHSASASETRQGPEQVFLCTPIRMYGTPHYQALACRFTELHPEVDDILFAHEMYRSKDEWRATFREKIARVTVCYALTDLNAYIGAGQFAELASMYGSTHPLQKLVAVNLISGRSIVTTLSS